MNTDKPNKARELSEAHKPNKIVVKTAYRLNVSILLDLELPPECIAGIDANAELLRIHARKLEAFEIPKKPFATASE